MPELKTCVTRKQSTLPLVHPPSLLKHLGTHPDGIRWSWKCDCRHMGQTKLNAPSSAALSLLAPTSGLNAGGEARANPGPIVWRVALAGDLTAPMSCLCLQISQDQYYSGRVTRRATPDPGCPCVSLPPSSVRRDTAYCSLFAGDTHRHRQHDWHVRGAVCVSKPCKRTGYEEHQGL